MLNLDLTHSSTGQPPRSALRLRGELMAVERHPQDMNVGIDSAIPTEKSR